MHYDLMGDAFRIQIGRKLKIHNDYPFHRDSLNFSTSQENSRTVITSVEILGSKFLMAPLMAQTNLRVAEELYGN